MLCVNKRTTMADGPAAPPNANAANQVGKPPGIVEPSATKYGKFPVVYTTVQWMRKQPMSGTGSTTWGDYEDITFEPGTVAGDFHDPNGSFFVFNLSFESSGVSVTAPAYLEQLATSVINRSVISWNNFEVENALEVAAFSAMQNRLLFGRSDWDTWLNWEGSNNEVYECTLATGTEVTASADGTWYFKNASQDRFIGANLVGAGVSNLPHVRQFAMVPYWSGIIGPVFSTKLVPAGFLNDYQITFTTERAKRYLFASVGTTTTFEVSTSKWYYHLMVVQPRAELLVLITRAMTAGRVPTFTIPILQYTRYNRTISASSSSYTQVIPMNLRSAMWFIVNLRLASKVADDQDTYRALTFSNSIMTNLTDIRLYVNGQPIPVYSTMDCTAQGFATGAASTQKLEAAHVTDVATTPKYPTNILQMYSKASMGGFYHRAGLHSMVKDRFSLMNTAVTRIQGTTAGLLQDNTTIVFGMDPPSMQLMGTRFGETVSGSNFQIDLQWSDSLSPAETMILDIWCIHAANEVVEGPSVSWIV